jgi:hypothetical protein
MLGAIGMPTIVPPRSETPSMCRVILRGNRDNSCLVMADEGGLDLQWSNPLKPAIPSQSKTRSSPTLRTLRGRGREHTPILRVALHLESMIRVSVPGRGLAKRDHCADLRPTIPAHRVGLNRRAGRLHWGSFRPSAHISKRKATGRLPPYAAPRHEKLVCTAQHRD